MFPLQTHLIEISLSSSSLSFINLPPFPLISVQTEKVYNKYYGLHKTRLLCFTQSTTFIMSIEKSPWRLSIKKNTGGTDGKTHGPMDGPTDYEWRCENATVEQWFESIGLYALKTRQFWCIDELTRRQKASMRSGNSLRSAPQMDFDDDDDDHDDNEDHDDLRFPVSAHSPLRVNSNLFWLNLDWAAIF